MNLWIAKARVGAECTYCHKDIPKSAPCIFGRTWIRKDNEGTDGAGVYWTKTYHWHIQSPDNNCCWIVQGLSVLDTKSSNSHTQHRGRKRLVLPADTRLQRLHLLQKRARLVQVINEQLEIIAANGFVGIIDTRPLNRIIAAGTKMKEMKVQIQQLGGVPKGWQ